jgi:hypothetical protein
MATAGYWEPDEPRGSRPVLRERGGETPPRHSPEGRRYEFKSNVKGWRSEDRRYEGLDARGVTGQAEAADVFF